MILTNLLIPIIVIPLSSIIFGTVIYYSFLKRRMYNNINLVIKENTNNPKYEINIDFDDASRMWNLNKTRLNNGCYSYKKINNCKGITKKGTLCKHKTAFDFCYLHNTCEEIWNKTN
tara:strand:- start:369 stop:719 length:351 start_codon:yes stop_codon:yes gene_type:complete